MKIKSLSSFNPEINFPAEHVMKINNLSRPNLPASPPPPQDQMVVTLVLSPFINATQTCLWENS